MLLCTSSSTFPTIGINLMWACACFVFVRWRHFHRVQCNWEWFVGAHVWRHALELPHGRIFLSPLPWSPCPLSLCLQLVKHAVFTQMFSIDVSMIPFNSFSVCICKCHSHRGQRN